jgi:hypothetical protein
MASPICVALVDARRLAFRMGRQGRADIESTLTRENKKTTAELKRVN